MITDFVSEARQIHWFANVGKPISDVDCVRLATWKDWPGPEDLDVADLFDFDSDLKDKILTSHPCQAIQLQRTFDLVHDEILHAAAALCADYKPDEDAWYAPTTAVWHAAWVAGLIAMHVELNMELPPSLAMEWSLFRAGHWPAGYAEAIDNRQSRRMLVY